MSCITTTSTAILINSTSTLFFQPSRGLRQGNPLSPYIFIMCMERLSHTIFQSVDYLMWKPIQLSQNRPQLSHLLFADDIILLSKVIKTSCHAIIDILNHFTTLSAQTISYLKSKIFFSKNYHTHDKNYNLSCFNMNKGKTFEKYLGFPMFQKKVNKADFQYLLDNFKTRHAGWKTKFLSLAGRTTLIKSTLSTLPNHIMQYISIPSSIIHKMEQYICNFLWGTTNLKRKFIWLNGKQ